MKFQITAIGKTDEPYLRQGMTIFQSRLKHYMPFEYEELPDVRNTKNMTETEQRLREGEMLLKRIKPGHELYLLDNNGREFSSASLASFIQNKMITCQTGMIFAIGGPYGFSPDVYARANGKVSLSKMTFSHQMVRLICLEQIYRAMTIIRGEPYHHE